MDLESETGNVSALDIQIAVVGAINTYLREVLEPKGIINTALDEAHPDHAGSERNSIKYRVATRAALVALGKAPDFDWRAELIERTATRQIEFLAPRKLDPELKNGANKTLETNRLPARARKLNGRYTAAVTPPACASRLAGVAPASSII